MYIHHQNKEQIPKELPPALLFQKIDLQKEGDLQNIIYQFTGKSTINNKGAQICSVIYNAHNDAAYAEFETYEIIDEIVAAISKASVSKKQFMTAMYAINVTKLVLYMWSAVVIRNLPPQSTMIKIEERCSDQGERVKYVLPPKMIKGIDLIRPIVYSSGDGRLGRCGEIVH